MLLALIQRLRHCLLCRCCADLRPSVYECHNGLKVGKLPVSEQPDAASGLRRPGT